MNDTATLLLSTVDRADPGDETLRRFRYQATYAATLAVGLLEDGGDVVEIYCEQYEDILLRLVSGKFRGVQIKTRSDGGEPLRATDEPILDSLLRFVDLELSFPGLFERFVLATNGAFDRIGKGHGNLPAVINEAQSHETDSTTAQSKASRLAKTLIARLKKKAGSAQKNNRQKRKINVAVDDSTADASKASASTPDSATPKQLPTEAEVLRIFAKLDLQDDLPKLPDIRSRIRQRLIQVSQKAANSTFPAVERVLDSLEYAAYLAASRGDEDRNGRYWFVSDPGKRAKLAVSDELQAKCLSRELVDDAIGRHCFGALLVSASPAKPEHIPEDLSRLDKKLVAGGLSAATISVAHDAVASVEEFGIRMLYVHGETEGLRRYNHARTVVKKECAFAYENQAAAGNVNGPRMLSDIEARLKHRRESDSAGALKECEEEHLLGHVFSLTKECVVWWSTSRNLSKVSNMDSGEESDDD